MPIVTNHLNLETDVELSGSLINDDTLNGITANIDSMVNSASSLELTNDEDVLGGSTVDDGGFIGDAMKLIRSHISDSLQKQEISKADAGGIYSQAVVAILQSSMDKYKFDIESKNDIQKTKSGLILSAIDAQIKLSQLKMSNVEYMSNLFNLKEIMPLDRELKKEDIEIKHTQHEIESKELETKSYNLSTILPAEKLKIDSDVAAQNKNIELKSYELTNLMPQRLALDVAKKDLAKKELDFKVYEFTNMLPLKKSKLESETAEALAKSELMAIDKLIKQYYKDNIQPEEKKSTESKARMDAINAALNGQVSDSLPYKRMTVLDKQDEVYAKQIGHYADQKNLDLLKIVTNYQSMIYPDLTGDEQSILSFANDENAADIYKSVAPPHIP